jgi:hypothetical protein
LTCGRGFSHEFLDALENPIATGQSLTYWVGDRREEVLSWRLGDLLRKKSEIDRTSLLSASGAVFPVPGT